MAKVSHGCLPPGKEAEGRLRPDLPSPRGATERTPASAAGSSGQAVSYSGSNAAPRKSITLPSSASRSNGAVKPALEKSA